MCLCQSWFRTRLGIVLNFHPEVHAGLAIRLVGQQPVVSPCAGGLVTRVGGNVSVVVYAGSSRVPVHLSCMPSRVCSELSWMMDLGPWQRAVEAALSKYISSRAAVAQHRRASVLVDL